MVEDAFVSLDLLLAAEAFDFKALAFVFNVFFEVFEVDALGYHVVFALVHYFDLAQHLFEQLVFDWHIHWLNDFDIVLVLRSCVSVSRSDTLF